MPWRPSHETGRIGQFHGWIQDGHLEIEQGQLRLVDRQEPRVVECGRSCRVPDVEPERGLKAHQADAARNSPRSWMVTKAAAGSVRAGGNVPVAWSTFASRQTAATIVRRAMSRSCCCSVLSSCFTCGLAAYLHEATRGAIRRQGQMARCRGAAPPEWVVVDSPDTAPEPTMCHPTAYLEFKT